MIVKRVGVLSAGKVTGSILAIIAIVPGVIITLGALGGVAVGGQAANQLPIGVAAIFFFPLIYGIGGFIGGVIYAALYNFVAAIVGGIEVEFAHAPVRDAGP